VPKDWRASQLGDFGTLRSGNGFPLKHQGRRDGDYPFFKVSDMNNPGNELFMDYANHWIDEDVRRAMSAEVFPAGSIVFAKIGAAIFLERKRLLVRDSCLDNNMMAYVLTDRGASTRFFHYVLLRVELAKLVSTTALPSLSGRQIASVRVPIPAPAEQRAIAEALSDVDELLGALEALIDKKRAIKQAAMQQLLTGKIRLPGFSGEWETKRLGSVLTVCHGKSQREVEMSHGPYPILATGGQIGTASRPLYDKPSVLIGRKGTIDQPQYMDRPFWTVDTLFYCAMAADNVAKFFFYRFCLIDWKQYNEASGVPSLNARTIEHISLACPKPAEQTAIATVLSDMDAEIAALEARRDKTRAIKQGMMQQLLTGRVRLVKPEAAA